MLSKHNNVATIWVAPVFREFEAYEVAVCFHKASDSHPFIVDQVHIIKEDETSYCKPANLWNSEPQQAHPRSFDMSLTKPKPSK